MLYYKVTFALKTDLECEEMNNDLISFNSWAGKIDTIFLTQTQQSNVI